MKALVVISTVILSVFLTLTTIFTIDSVTVRKAELASIAAVNYSAVVEDFFEGNISSENLRQVITNEFREASHSKFSKIDVTVKRADAEKGVLNFLIEITYAQPNGRPRLISIERVYIKEKNEALPSVEEYSFIRTINANCYKTAGGLFVEETDGGLRENSIWRTPDYEMILDSVFSIE